MDSKDSKSDFKPETELDEKDAKGAISQSESKDDDLYIANAESKDVVISPKLWLISMEVEPDNICLVSSPLELKITFELERDAIAGYWIIKFLVDSADQRIIKILGDTKPEDYLEGENEMYFSIENIIVDDISPSTLTNSGLLMACFISEGEEAASINLVVNVFQQDGDIMREIFNPGNGSNFGT